MGQPGFVRWKQVLSFAGYSCFFGVGCGLTWGLMAAAGASLWTYLLGAATLLCLAAAALALPFAGFLYVWGRLFPKSPLIDNTFQVLSEVGKGLDAAADFVESTAGDSQRMRESTPGNSAPGSLGHGHSSLDRERRFLPFEPKHLDGRLPVRVGHLLCRRSDPSRARPWRCFPYSGRRYRCARPHRR